MFLLKNQWFTKFGLQVLKYIDVADVDEEGFKDYGMPNANHPSDHYALAYQIAIKFSL